MRKLHFIVLAFASRPAQVFLLTFFIVWATALTVANQVPKEYQSTAVVAFQPRDPLVAGAETMTLVAPKYVELLRSPELIGTVANQLGVSASEIRSSTSGVIEPNTLNLRVITKGAVPAAVADQANVVAARVVAVAAADPLLSAQMVAWAVSSSTPLLPTPANVRLLGLVVGLGAAFTVGAGALRRGGRDDRQSGLRGGLGR